MPANTTPNFTLTPRDDVAQVAAANVNRDGTGTIVNVCTAAANGTRIELVRIQAIVATTVGVVRLFIFDGTNLRLYKELLIPARTPSTTTEAYGISYRPDEPIVLANGHALRASTHNAEAFNVHVHGGDY